MVSRYSNSLVVLLLIAVLAIVSAAQLPSSFSAKFSVTDRPTQKITATGLFSITNQEHVEAILQIVKTHQIINFYNGKIETLGKCTTNNKRSVEGDIFEGVLSALKNIDAHKIDDSLPIFDFEVLKCTAASRRVIYVAGEAMVLCLKQTEASAFALPEKIISQNLIVEIQQASQEALLLGTRNRLANCPLQDSSPSSSSSSSSSSLPLFTSAELQNSYWFNQLFPTCSLRFLRDETSCLASSQNSAVQEASKICIFLHGAGQTQEETGEPVQEFKSYWGDVNQYTPQCKERWFIREETKLQTWETPHLQEAYCKLALYNQSAGDTVIRNKILFVHSMGNLILANALRNKVCEIDHTTTSYYALGAPWIGSKASIVVEDICATIRTGKLPPWTQIYKMYKYVAEKFGYCMPHTNETYPVYKSFDPNNPDIKTLYAAISEKVTGSMCGSSAVGLVSAYSPALTIFSDIVQYREHNDGFVPVSSCKQQTEQDLYKYEPGAAFYLAELNHADETCRNGDGIGKDRKPCSYYTGKM